MQKIDFTKLRRNYLIQPLKLNKSSRYTEMPFYEDLQYLYITLNLTKNELSKIFNCSIGPITRWIKLYNIKKSNEKRIDSIKHVLLEKKKDPNYQLKINNKREEKNLSLYGVRNCFQSKEKKEKIKEKLLKIYGVDNCSKSEKIKNKKARTCLLNWGKDNPSKSEIIIEKIRNTKIKNHTTNLEIAKDKNKQRQINLKSYMSRKLNHTFRSSKVETKLYNLLLQKFSKTLHPYRSDVYPFNCDFYIPELQLYIEYQGCWTHGPYNCHEPFDANNPKHLEVLNKLKLKSEEINCFGRKKKFFLSTINTWTVRDPLKRKTAKDNNLKWKEFFTEEEFMKWYNSLE